MMTRPSAATLGAVEWPDQPEAVEALSFMGSALWSGSVVHLSSGMCCNSQKAVGGITSFDQSPRNRHYDEPDRRWGHELGPHLRSPI
jgi:hypothetical protein